MSTPTELVDQLKAVYTVLLANESAPPPNESPEIRYTRIATASQATLDEVTIRSELERQGVGYMYQQERSVFVVARNQARAARLS